MAPEALVQKYILDSVADIQDSGWSYTVCIMIGIRLVPAEVDTCSQCLAYSCPLPKAPSAIRSGDPLRDSRLNLQRLCDALLHVLNLRTFIQPMKSKLTIRAGGDMS